MIEQEKEIKSIVMTEKDNVATVLEDLNEQNTISFFRNGKRQWLTAKQSVPFGHKISIKHIKKSGAVIKYGEVIGAATRDIEPGEHVHIHNIEGIRGRGDKTGEGAVS